MADIFISYTRSDSKMAQLIVDRLRELDLPIQWDNDIDVASQNFTEMIMSRVESAKVLLALWSRQSVDSSWVKTEADAAAKQGRLINVLIDDVKPPLGFTRYQHVNLRGWDGFSRDREWQKLLAAILRLL